MFSYFKLPLVLSLMFLLFATIIILFTQLSFSNFTLAFIVAIFLALIIESSKVQSKWFLILKKYF
jgi:hypothetical protein